MRLTAAGFGLLVLLGAIYLFIGEQTMADQNSRSVSLRPSADQRSREYVLEIIGLGVTLDKYRQGKLWDQLMAESPYSSIRDMDPKSYPWDGVDKMQLSGGHDGASLENAVLDTPRYWGTPVFNAEPRCLDKRCSDRPELPQGGIVAGEVMMRIPVLADRELSEHPDRIIERVFSFFDQNPDVPYIVLGSRDSTTVRARYSSPRKLLETGYYVPDRPDTSAVFVLARRERVDQLRPFVFQDLEEPQPDVDVLNRDGIARRVWLNYMALEEKVPAPPERALHPGHTSRQPTSTEWLADLEIFRKQFTEQGTRKLNFKIADVFNLHKPKLSRHWKPTPWFPVPWNTEQLEQFDRLPTLGFLHRPVFVKMVDADGKPLKHEADRQAALHDGWKSALETLPAAQRVKGPARVIVATGGKTSQLLDFHGLLRKVAEDGGPKFDPAKVNNFIDIDHRLGNTGAATFFMQAAIGVLGSYREGGISAAFNLRDPDEVSIIFISPPSDEKRKSQQHPIGGDVLQNATVPAIDPKNYEEPIPR